MIGVQSELLDLMGKDRMILTEFIVLTLDSSTDSAAFKTSGSKFSAITSLSEIWIAMKKSCSLNNVQFNIQAMEQQQGYFLKPSSCYSAQSCTFSKAVILAYHNLNSCNPLIFII